MRPTFARCTDHFNRTTNQKKCMCVAWVSLPPSGRSHRRCCTFRRVLWIHHYPRRTAGKPLSERMENEHTIKTQLPKRFHTGTHSVVSRPGCRAMWPKAPGWTPRTQWSRPVGGKKPKPEWGRMRCAGIWSCVHVCAHVRNLRCSRRTRGTPARQTCWDRPAERTACRFWWNPARWAARSGSLSGILCAWRVNEWVRVGERGGVWQMSDVLGRKGPGERQWMCATVG